MRFSCTQENLRTALTLVSHIAARQGPLPILSNVLLRAETKALTIAATNLEVAVTVQLRGRVEDDGAFTANAKLLDEVVGLLPRDRVDARVEGTELALTCGGSATRIRGMDAAEFPLIPEVVREREVRVPAVALRDALGKVAFAVAASGARPELTGVLLTCDGTTARLAATDSYRLAEVILPLAASSVAKGTTAIIPGRSVQEILRILGVLEGSEDAPDEVTLALTPSQCFVTAGPVTLTSRLVDGAYPDYTQILPQSWTTRAVVSRHALQTTARAAALFTRTGVQDIHFRMVPKGKQCIVRSENAQLGEHQATIEAAVDGEEVTTILNARYFLEGLATIPGDTVAIELTGAAAPVKLVPVGDGADAAPHAGGGHLYIIMPIKQ